MRTIIPLVALLLCAGCVTSQSTVRQIERQQKLVEVAKDALSEAQDRLDKAQNDLNALRVQRLEEEAAPAVQ